jgi:hypothetical protein
MFPPEFATYANNKMHLLITGDVIDMVTKAQTNESGNGIQPGMPEKGTGIIVCFRDGCVISLRLHRRAFQMAASWSFVRLKIVSHDNDLTDPG